VSPRNILCTKIAAKLLRFQDSSLQALLESCVDKSLQASDPLWETLSDEQVSYAVHEAAPLSDLLIDLERRLEQAGRIELARACFENIRA